MNLGRSSASRKFQSLLRLQDQQQAGHTTGGANKTTPYRQETPCVTRMQALACGGQGLKADCDLWLCLCILLSQPNLQSFYEIVSRDYWTALRL